MTKPKSAVKPSPRGIQHGNRYPGVHGKVVDWADHGFAEGILYIRIRFADRTEMCWRVVSSIVIEEADLSDWKTGDFKPVKVFVQNESGRD